jgi:hypothetical protein
MDCAHGQEDDVHKSIKHSAWTSTATGNQRLQAAWDSRQSSEPIYLFFSVNSSQQFVGMAELASAYTEAKVNYWSQDKWEGHFKVRWIFVKDIPNTALKGILLPNNENKSVTKSRDTQEVPLAQGVELLKIFASYAPCQLEPFGSQEHRRSAHAFFRCAASHCTDSLVICGTLAIGSHSLQSKLSILKVRHASRMLDQPCSLMASVGHSRPGRFDFCVCRRYVHTKSVLNDFEYYDQNSVQKKPAAAKEKAGSADAEAQASKATTGEAEAEASASAEKGAANA